jgi:hypothetical protein
MGRSTGALTKGVAVGGKLPPGELRVTRLGDANKVRMCFAPSFFPLADSRVAGGECVVHCGLGLWVLDGLSRREADQRVQLVSVHGGGGH